MVAQTVPTNFVDHGPILRVFIAKIVRMFGPKTAIFAPKYDFLGTYRPCRLAHL